MPEQVPPRKRATLRISSFWRLYVVLAAFNANLHIYQRCCRIMIPVWSHLLSWWHLMTVWMPSSIERILHSQNMSDLQKLRLAKEKNKLAIKHFTLLKCDAILDMNCLTVWLNSFNTLKFYVMYQCFQCSFFSITTCTLITLFWLK